MTNNNYLSNFVDYLLSLQSQEEMLNFLEGILTPKEISEIPVRLEIVKMLKAGIPQHKIAEKLKVGVGTVTRGSKEIHNGRFKDIQATKISRQQNGF